MKNPRMIYFEDSDILHVSITNDKESGRVEIASNITAEFNEKGEPIGVEILDASLFVRDIVMESVQARMLQLPDATLNAK